MSQNHPPVAVATPEACRRAMRKTLIARREALPEALRQQFSQAIAAHLCREFPQLARMRVVFCWPFRHEPDLRPQMTRWQAAGGEGFSALLPVVVTASGPLAFRVWRPETPMQNDRYGIPFPVEGDFIRPEALLIPVNAFDAAGFRLGYGGGYFDRTLAALPDATLRIGVGFELSRVGTVYPQAHDQALDFIVTEAGVFRSQGKDA